ncbi:hypothetical protein JCM17845_10350 [Iodidimonas gelatinilytica]|uniref:Flagellar biosynthesis protein FliO n=2 Tax=Iodidimonas gelatinilytica TaxID=1236966 RepID=A0A5A7MWU5_9PROT|nr:flagellar biosynthetic protein FliO [Iodidimonas gelatinilytica]GER00412.1 hypothetical protein JCM17845_10350 [Iodidimonas gelatinilytica]
MALYLLAFLSQKAFMTSLDVANAIFSLLIVIGLIAALAFLVRRLGRTDSMAILGKKRASRRLVIREKLNVDARNYLVLVACDDQEHLVMVNQSGGFVVEKNIPQNPVQASDTQPSSAPYNQSESHQGASH